MGYFNSALKGLSWMTAFRIFYRLIGVARIAVIARILSPYGLGVWGIVTMLLGFLEIITETGINVFLVQEKDNIDDFVNTAWIVSIFRGILIALLILISGSFVSQFFKSPESKNLFYLVALVPFIRGFINPSIMKFQKELRFNKEFFYRASIFFVESVLSVIGVLITKSALGLVLGIIFSALYEVVYTFIVARPRPIFNFDLLKMKRVFNRGKWITLFGIFDYLYTQMDNVIVGRILGVSSIGIYDTAYTISTTPLTEVGDIFFRVTFPIFSKISSETDRLKKAFIKTLVVNSAVMIASGVLIFIFADLIVKILFGNNWTSTVPVVKLLSVLGVTRGIASSTNSLLVAKGMQKYSAIVTLVSTLGLLITIVPLIKSYGIVGAAISAIIGTVISLPLTIYFVNKTLKE